MQCNWGTVFLNKGKNLGFITRNQSRYNESKQESNWYTCQKISKERKQKAMSTSKQAMWKTEYPIPQHYKLPYTSQWKAQPQAKLSAPPHEQCAGSSVRLSESATLVSSMCSRKSLTSSQISKISPVKVLLNLTPSQPILVSSTPRQIL